MHIASLKLKPLTAALVTIGALPLAAIAAPPANSPYNTDAQSIYVQDATSEGVSQLNMVLCIMNAMSPADMVNAGPYVALIDKNKCDTSHRDSAANSSSTSSGATAAPDYMKAVVDVTRASTADPMVGKVWMHLDDHGNSMTVYLHLSATQAPSASTPYGVFRLDYLGKANNQTAFNGYIDSGTTSIKYYEDSFQGAPQSSALAIAASSTTAGAGTMSVPDPGNNQIITFDFAYNPTMFRRSDGTLSGDKCFDRAQTNAEKSVWRYGTYNAIDGTRVDQAHPGFQIIAGYGGSTYYGFAGYWGINFQGLDLNTIADGSPVAGLTVTDQRPGNTTTYNLSKLGGKLTKYTKAASTLSAIDGIPMQAWGDFYALTGNNPLLQNVFQVEFHWDNANSRFVITGQQSCGQNGCVTAPLAGNATVSFAAANQDINGFSQSLGGPVSIPHSSPYGAGSAVNYYTQSVVIPGSAGAPTTMYCLNNCLSESTLAAFNGGNSPFDPATQTQWFSGANRDSYSFGSTGLIQAGGTLPLVNTTGPFSGNFQSGIQMGKLYATDLTGVANCPNTYCEPDTDYYTWETGSNQWNQSLWLTTGNNVVALDPPQNIAYTVTSGDDPGGPWVGRAIQLQFSGFGNLWGIPGACVNPVDNSPTACSGPGVRFVPEFALGDGDTMSLSGTPLIVKALDAELRLKNVACPGSGLSLNSQALPTATDLHDPSLSSDAFYIGSQPTPSVTTPKVIHGVVQ